ncbi:glycosyltransferase [Virgibacillus sp. W0430]|uniref:glycosyltransferase n=1 Tax=Virgibacillus sp. W0430 TaxID=3391580 RepID=UPI003F48C193
MKRSVFYDSEGKRWKVLKTVGLFLFLCGYTWLIVSITVFYIKKSLPIITQSVISFLIITFTFYLLITIIIGMLRLCIFMYLSGRQASKNGKGESVSDDYTPLVSVIIPAYNEDVGIKKTIYSVLNSNYPIYEIIVVDDGSTDRTNYIVKKIARKHKRIKLISKINGGKSTALNKGFKKAKGEIVVTIDADNLLLKDTISYLVRHFKDDDVAAVSGNCKIGNAKRQLPIWQHIEYVTANNLEKRALDYLNCITIVPGSNSAWRRSLIKEIGYYDHDTLAEDTDITLKVISRNYRIIYEDRAITYEECPETVQAFLKQRLRWSYGILQSLWKNRKMIRLSKNNYLKYFAVPNMLMIYLFYLTIPLVDILFIITFAIYGNYVVFLFFLFFFVTDTIASVYAFMLEKENKKTLKWIFVQRLAYRYLFTYIIWKTIITVLKGTGLKWRESVRTGNHL